MTHTGSYIQAIRDSALIRNRIEGVIKAASSPMSGSEIANWPSVTEITGTNSAGKGRTFYQLSRMVKEGLLEAVGNSSARCYTWKRKPEPLPVSDSVPVPVPTIPSDLPTPALVAQPSVSTSTDLHIKVNKTQRAVSLVFQGFSITIEVQ